MSVRFLTILAFVLTSPVSTQFAFAGPFGEACDLALLGESSRQAIAEQAGLHYLRSFPAGITRNGVKGAYVYRLPDGMIISDEGVLARVSSLNIPAGYRNVWISTDPVSHIQATALDDKGRKQYRYHPLWKNAKSAIKFDRMVEFGNTLPLMHAKEAADLSADGLGKEKVLASVAVIMEKTAIRVGSEEYARDNGTYGLTTLLKGHVTMHEGSITFEFVGKASVEHSIDYYATSAHDPVLEVVRTLSDTGGDAELTKEKLFQFQDASGNFQSVSAPMFNDYLEQISAKHFTAKDFRTWMGTVTAAKTLMGLPLAAGASTKEVERNIAAAVKAASDRLGNSPAVARQNYIEPSVLQAYRDGAKFEEAKHHAMEKQNAEQLPEELLVLELLGSPAEFP